MAISDNEGMDHSNNYFELKRTDFMKLFSYKPFDGDQNFTPNARQKEDIEYDKAIESGEKALKDGSLTMAKIHFQTAAILKPNEILPEQRLKEIEALIEQRNKK